MPKSAKKRKDKAADFSKAKLKLGKGKQLASNAIDTSFKARSIALPSQSINIDKDDATPTTKRRLTFDDLIAHLKHYSAGTRKDAIAGLLLGDEDSAVRKSLYEFFVWLFPRIYIVRIPHPFYAAPHATTLLLFTTSAQTHIFPEIRVDAIRFLNLFLEYIPAETVAGWNQGDTGNGSRVLEGYLGILSAGTKFGETDGPMKATSTASVVLTPASKLVVLQSLSSFLRYAVSSPSTSRDRSTPLSASPIDTCTEAYDAFDHLLQPRNSQSQNDAPRIIWQKDVVDLEYEDHFPCSYPLLGSTFGGNWTFELLSATADVLGTGADEDANKSGFVAHLARTLHSALISTFLDCAPSVFAPNGSVDETQAKLIVAIAEITRHLYGVILQSTSEAVLARRATASVDLKSILGYMAVYFPFKLSGTRDIKVEQAFQALNLIFCELTSLLILTSEPAPNRRGKERAAQGQEGSKDGLQVQTERVSDYVVQLLRGESTSTSQLGRVLTPVAYTALLPTIWSLINAHSSLYHLSSDVLQATIEHASKVSSKSVLKQVTIEFVARIILLDTEAQFKGNLKIGRGTEENKKVAQWLDHLPKCLWELGSNNIATTERIHRCAVTSLRSQIVPYFCINHTVRGQVPGPYCRLPSASPVRRLALDLAKIIGDDPSLSSAVDAAVSGTPEQSYWHNIHV
ncbi:hypothetical protein B0H10DRAFT_2166190 [Mycena sp. CBHHK59/15]|nr:hypothetical protein B0H10DRAFT_2166190 [Mycena sp. CBHHK59/15]